MIQKKWLRWLIVSMTIISLTACTANEDEAIDPGQGMNVEQGSRMKTNQMDLRNQNVTPRQYNGNAGMHQNTRVELSEDIAEKIADMKEVESANVFLTDQNAYIAVMLEDEDNNNRRTVGVKGRNPVQDGMDEQLKERIAERARSINPDVANVFVSSNPDFLDRMNNFVDQVQAGNPVQGFVNEFNTMVERMFPENLD